MKPLPKQLANEGDDGFANVGAVFANPVGYVLIQAKANPGLRLESFIAITLNANTVVSALSSSHLLRFLHRRGLRLVDCRNKNVLDALLC